MMDPSRRRVADSEPGDWVAGPVVSRGRSPAWRADPDFEPLGPLVVTPRGRPPARAPEGEATGPTGTPPDSPSAPPLAEAAGAAAEMEELPWLMGDASTPSILAETAPGDGGDEEGWSSEEAPQPYLESWGDPDAPSSADPPADSVSVPAHPAAETDFGVTGDEVTEAMTPELLGEAEETPPAEPVDWSPRPGYSAASTGPGTSGSRETATWEMVTQANDEDGPGAPDAGAGSASAEGDRDAEGGDADDGGTVGEGLASHGPVGSTAPDDGGPAEETKSSWPTGEVAQVEEVAVEGAEREEPTGFPHTLPGEEVDPAPPPSGEPEAEPGATAATDPATPEHGTPAPAGSSAVAEFPSSPDAPWHATPMDAAIPAADRPTPDQGTLAPEVTGADAGLPSSPDAPRHATPMDAAIAAAGDPTADQARALAARLERIARALREQGPGGALSQRRGDPLAALITGYLLGSAEPARSRDADPDEGEPEPDPR
jgi:hypothetical protein